MGWLAYVILSSRLSHLFSPYHQLRLYARSAILANKNIFLTGRGVAMDERKPVALSAIVIDENWEQALTDALDQIKDISADIVFFFASNDFSDHYPEMVRRIRCTTHTPILIGCSG